MTLATEVTETEIEVIRLYEIALPLQEASSITADDVADALGTPRLNEEYVDIFDINTLDEMGLKGYMVEGLGVPKDSITPYSERIAQIDGFVVVVLSKAFESRPIALLNSHPLRLVGAFTERQADQGNVDLTSKAATEKMLKPTKKPKSQAAQSGMIATFALLFMFLFVAVIVWIA